jgi:hypothetical protein
MNSIRQVALLIVATLALMAWPASGAPAGASDPPPRLGALTNLKPGVYRTGRGFAPSVRFTVPGRWWGEQYSSTAWSIGKLPRTDPAPAALFVDALRLPFDRAVTIFRSLKTLRAGTGVPVRIGGYPGTTFTARVEGEHAPLIALGTGADIPAGVIGQQTFLDVRGRTLLIRLELKRGSTLRPEALTVLRSFRFPR